MLKALVLPLALILASVSCGRRIFVPENNEKQPSVNDRPAAFAESNRKIETSDDYCEKWDRAYNTLKEKDRERLKEEKILSVSSNDSENFHYLISRELIENCEQSLKIGQFLWKAQIGIEPQTEADRDFASKNLKQLVKVLRQVWDSEDFTSDGLHESKYNLLSIEGIKDEDMSLLMSDLIKKKVVDVSLLNIVLEHPLRSLKPAVSKSLKQAEKKGDLGQQICYLIMLEGLSASPAYLSKLERINESPQLEKKTKIAIAEIVSKFQSGKKISFDDLSQLPIIDAEQNK